MAADEDAVHVVVADTGVGIDARDREWKEQRLKFTIQVAPEDCTGCALCIDVCPARNKSEPKLKAIKRQQTKQ